MKEINIKNLILGLLLVTEALAANTASDFTEIFRNDSLDYLKTLFKNSGDFMKLLLILLFATSTTTAFADVVCSDSNGVDAIRVYVDSNAVGACPIFFDSNCVGRLRVFVTENAVGAVRVYETKNAVLAENTKCLKKSAKSVSEIGADAQNAGLYINY